MRISLYNVFINVAASLRIFIKKFILELRDIEYVGQMMLDEPVGDPHIVLVHQLLCIREGISV